MGLRRTIARVISPINIDDAIYQVGAGKQNRNVAKPSKNKGQAKEVKLKEKFKKAKKGKKDKWPRHGKS